MLQHYQKNLRQNQTDAEHIIWKHLRDRRLNGCKFRRQQIIHGYIVDFICFEKNLVIELDGGQHSEQLEYDEHRTAMLAKEGFRVMRFWNNDVIGKTELVLSEIYGALVNERVV